MWDALPAWGGATAAAAAAAAASAAAPAAPYVTFTPETIAGDAPPPSPSGFCGDHGWIAKTVYMKTFQSIHDKMYDYSFRDRVHLTKNSVNTRG